MSIKQKHLIIKIAITIIGAIAGYSYWYYVGCNSGNCPIYSKWHWSTMYGAGLGFLLVGIFVKEPKKDEKKNINIDDIDEKK